MKKVDPPKAPAHAPSEQERKEQLEKSKTPELLRRKLERPITDLRELEDEDDPESEDSEESEAE